MKGDLERVIRVPEVVDIDFDTAMDEWKERIDRMDEEVNLDYSNLIQKECPTLGDAMYIMQEWQRAGYQNINVMTQVKHNGAIVVEDTANDVQFVSNEERDLREAYDTMCDAYGKTLAFIDAHKARKVYEEYIAAQ